MPLGAPDAYAHWYQTARGRWIAKTERALLAPLLDAQPHDTVLDVGCGTGEFTVSLVKSHHTSLIGLDVDLAFLRHAAAHQAPGPLWLAADAGNLPFPDHSVDRVVSVTALCFLAQDETALREMLRVARTRVVVAWLNRESALYRAKAGQGAYRGARWVSPEDLRATLARLPVARYRLRSAVFRPAGDWPARLIEPLIPTHCLSGALLVAALEPRR